VPLEAHRPGHVDPKGIAAQVDPGAGDQVKRIRVAGRTRLESDRGLGNVSGGHGYLAAAEFN
jgi:hypothetical protein